MGCFMHWSCQIASLWALQFFCSCIMLNSAAAIPEAQARVVFFPRRFCCQNCRAGMDEHSMGRAGMARDQPRAIHTTLCTSLQAHVLLIRPTAQGVRPRSPYVALQHAKLSPQPAARPTVRGRGTTRRTTTARQPAGGGQHGPQPCRTCP